MYFTGISTIFPFDVGKKRKEPAGSNFSMNIQLNEALFIWRYIFTSKRCGEEIPDVQYAYTKVMQDC